MSTALQSAGPGKPVSPVGRMRAEKKRTEDDGVDRSALKKQPVINDLGPLAIDAVMAGPDGAQLPNVSWIPHVEGPTGGQVCSHSMLGRSNGGGHDGRDLETADFFLGAIAVVVRSDTCDPFSAPFAYTELKNMPGPSRETARLQSRTT